MAGKTISKNFICCALLVVASLLSAFQVRGQAFARAPSSNSAGDAFFQAYGHPWLSSLSVFVKTGLTAYDGNFSRFEKFRLQNNYLNPHVSIGLHKRFWQHASLRYEISYAQIRSSSNLIALQKVAFVNSTIDQFVAFQFDTRPRSDYDIRYRSWAAWALAGVGSIHFQIPSTVADDVVRRPQGKWQHALQIPIGIGGGKQLSDFLFVGAELVYHHTFTDLLDGVDSGDQSSNTDKILTFSLFVQYQFKRPFHYDSYLKQKRRR